MLWRQTSPDPAKTASYSLSLWPTGASTASSPCTVNLIESQMDAVVYQGGDSTKPLRLPSAPLCNSVTNLAKGRCGTGRCSGQLHMAVVAEVMTWSTAVVV